MIDRPSKTTAAKERKKSNTDAVAAVAKALGHPARVEIVALLHERQTCIGCDIVDQVGLAQSTTSEHLRLLKEAGVIIGEIERPRVCYSLNPEVLEPLHAFLGEVLRPREQTAPVAVTVSRGAVTKKGRPATPSKVG